MVWRVKEGKLPKNTNAVTVPMAGGAITTVDYKKLRNAAGVSVARTMIHELVHAYLSLSFRYEALRASQEYPQMKANWQATPRPDLNEVHHAEMAASFVDHIALGLKEYGRNMSKDVEDWVYWGLAWGGLDFHGSKQLTEENKVRVEQLLRAGQFCAVAFRRVLTDDKTGG